MNRQLVERIERLIGLCDDPGTEQELTLMLADVRELIEATQPFRCDFSPVIPKDEPIAYVLTVGQYNRLSAILRKVGGE